MAGKGWNENSSSMGTPEPLGQVHRQLQAGRIIAPFEETDGLGIDADGIRQRLAAQAGLGSEQRDSVVNFPDHVG